MTGLLICAAVVAAVVGWMLTGIGGLDRGEQGPGRGVWSIRSGLALIAVALWLAYAAGGA